MHTPQELKSELKNDTRLDQTLRPSTFEEYIGQNSIKKNIKILLQASQERNHPPEHILFYGPPGLGKTTLAHLIAKEQRSQMKITSGPAIEKVGDLASLLTNLAPGDILFIDEIHRLSKLIEEILYPAMESGNLDIIIGKGPSARTIQLELPPFTLIAATTRIALLSSPLRSRFSGGTYRLEYYTDDEISQIVTRSAELLGITIDKDAAHEIARRSRGTPRIANALLRRVRDFAQVKGTGAIELAISHHALAALNVDQHGLDEMDNRILSAIIDKFKGGPVGITTIGTAVGEESGTIEEVYEPFLIKEGYLKRTPRGREATELAYKHLGRTQRPTEGSLF